MYLNDCQRTAFYEGIGLDTKEFDMHVIIEVSTMSVFFNHYLSVILIISSDIPQLKTENRYAQFGFAFYICYNY